MNPRPSRGFSDIQKAVRGSGQLSLSLQNADNSVHCADFSHTLDQVLLHGHNQIPPKNKFKSGRGLRTVDSPRMVQKLFALLLADDSAHLTDGLHTADQILLHRHCVTSNFE